MSSVERIEKFFTDLDDLTSSSSGLRYDKYAGVVRRLIAWLMKHQDENVPSSAKARIVEILGRVRATLTSTNSTTTTTTSNTTSTSGVSKAKVEAKDIDAGRAVTTELLEMYCALPEGKLTTSKSKLKLVRWLEEFGSAHKAAAAAKGGRKGVAAGERYNVIDCEEASGGLTFTLESCSRGDSDISDILEKVSACDDALASCVLRAFDAFCDEADAQHCIVLLSSNSSVIVEILPVEPKHS